jgi:WD40 repeat protein
VGTDRQLRLRFGVPGHRGPVALRRGQGGRAGPYPITGVDGVAFSPDGKLLASTGGDGYVRLWGPATHKPIGKPIPANLANGEGVQGVAFSPYGKLLGIAGSSLPPPAP